MIVKASILSFLLFLASIPDGSAIPVYPDQPPDGWPVVNPEKQHKNVLSSRQEGKIYGEANGQLNNKIENKGQEKKINGEYSKNIELKSKVEVRETARSMINKGGIPNPSPTYKMKSDEGGIPNPSPTYKMKSDEGGISNPSSTYKMKSDEGGISNPSSTYKMKSDEGGISNPSPTYKMKSDEDGVSNPER